MPESMTSTEWVVAGWGFACGVVLTLALVLPYVWRLKAQIPTKGRPTWRRRLGVFVVAHYRVVRDAFEELSARMHPVSAMAPPTVPVVEPTDWLSALPTPLHVSDIMVGPAVQERYAPRFRWNFIDSGTGVRYPLVTEAPEPIVPDEERRVESDEDGYPHDRRGHRSEQFAKSHPPNFRPAHSTDGPTVRLPDRISGRVS
jgi:hypothetical protein